MDDQNPTHEEFNLMPEDVYEDNDTEIPDQEDETLSRLVLWKRSRSCIEKLTNLPDELVHHIFSFLPTKDIVKTSILSKRWKILWTSNPTINLDDTQVPNYQNFVFNIFKSLTAMPIRKFSFTFMDEYDSWCIDAWLDAATKLRPREICIKTGNYKFNLFLSTSPRCLKLEIPSLEVGSLVDLKNLKTLHLYSVSFADLNSSINLFSGCANLEELILDSCPWDSFYFEISIYSLKRLEIFDPSSESSGLVQYVDINAPNLVYFKYDGYFATEYSLINTKSLENVSMDLDYCKTILHHKYVPAVAGLLKAVSSVRTLKLTDHSLGTFFFASEDDRNLFPYFHNLKHLNLTGIASLNSINALLRLLQSVDALESLVVSTEFYVLKKISYDENPKSVPNSLRYHLKTITMQRFRGDEEELDFLGYLVKNAYALETTRVLFCKISAEEKIKVQEKLRHDYHDYRFRFIFE
ncbi:hypothetical protein ACHQM5_023162 [Ranunculus cassubicifolius]